MIVLSSDQSMEGPAGFAVLDLALPLEKQLLWWYTEWYKKSDGHFIPKTDTRWRCLRFAKLFQELIVTYKPDVVVTEIVRAYHMGFTNTNVVAALSEIQGAMNLVTPRHIPIIRLNTSSWQAIMLHGKRADDKKKLSIVLAEKIFNKTFT